MSKNTIKAWDNYPNNLPEEVKMRVQLNQLQRTKAQLKPIEDHPNMPQLNQEELPNNINELEILAVRLGLQKGIFLLDYTYNSKEYSEVINSIIKLIQLPVESKTPKPKSVTDLLMEIVEREKLKKP